MFSCKYHLQRYGNYGNWAPNAVFAKEAAWVLLRILVYPFVPILFQSRCWYFHRVRIVLVTLFCLIACCGYSQTLKSILDKGDKLFAKNDYKGALQVYQSAEKIAPNDPKVKYRIGQSYLSAGAEVKALPYLEDAYRQQPDVDPDIDYFLAWRCRPIFILQGHRPFQEVQNKNKKLSLIADHKIRECRMGDSLIVNPVLCVIKV